MLKILTAAVLAGLLAGCGARSSGTEDAGTVSETGETGQDADTSDETGSQEPDESRERAGQEEEDSQTTQEAESGQTAREEDVSVHRLYCAGSDHGDPDAFRHGYHH